MMDGPEKQELDTATAFVTPTFLPDLKRCELLVRSLDRAAPTLKHYLLVDSFEMAHFRHLQSNRTILVPAEELIGLRQLRVRLDQNYWLHPSTLPMRGWVRQQILKMAAAATLDEDVFVCLDSDVAFIRPFDPTMLLENGKLGLLDVDYHDRMLERWTATAHKILGMADRRQAIRGHVGHLITWSRAHMRELQQKIEEEQRARWQVALGRCKTFSEYVLYAVFIRESIGYERSHHAPSMKPLVRQPWEHDLTTAEGLRKFICEPDDGNVAVMVHSKFGLPTSDISRLVEGAWRD